MTSYLLWIVYYVQLWFAHSKADLTDSEGEGDNVLTTRGSHSGGHTYQEEQQEVKDELKKAFDENCLNDEQVLTLRVKTDKEMVCSS